MIKNASTLHIPSILLLNKSDKISKNKAHKILYNIKNKTIFDNVVTCHYFNIGIFSSIKLYGIKSITKIIDYWIAQL